MNQEELLKECEYVRKQMETFAQEGILLFMPVKNFPCGWCGLASRVLGVWLLNKEPYSEFYYVCGYLKDQSHAWIRHNKWIVDITPDQFKGITDKVIVAETSSLHHFFRIEFERQINKCDINYSEENKLFQYLQKTIDY